MTGETITNFNMLFDFIYGMQVHSRAQRTWNGITAGLCTRHLLFLQADGFDAVLDTRTSQIRFNQGNADMLCGLMAEYLMAAA